METDFKDLIKLPGELRRPEGVAEGSHQLTLLARALGGVFNGVRQAVYNLRRGWTAKLAPEALLEEHGKDRDVHRRAGEPLADFRARVLLGLRAKTPGETIKGMGLALDSLGLVNYELHELYRLTVEDPADPRWDEFEVRFPDTGNEGLTDAEILDRVNAAKPPRSNGILVRYAGATIDGFGRTFGTDFGS